MRFPRTCWQGSCLTRPCTHTWTAQCRILPLCAKLRHKKHWHTYGCVQTRTNVYGRVRAMFWTIFDRTDMKISLYRVVFRVEFDGDVCFLTPFPLGSLSCLLGFPLAGSGFVLVFPFVSCFSGSGSVRSLLLYLRGLLGVVFRLTMIVNVPESSF